MKQFLKITICSVIVLMFATFIQAQSTEIQTNGKVCGKPSVPCSHSKWKFKANDISFKLPKTLEWQKNYYSADFYVIVLKNKPAVPAKNPNEKCGGYFSESERQKAQKQFSRNKVFASRFGCGEPGIGYADFDSDNNFLAVYAGETEADANNFLKTVKAKGYSDASIKKTQVILGYGD